MEHRNNLLQLAITRTLFEGSPNDLSGHLQSQPSDEYIALDHDMAKCYPHYIKKYRAKYASLITAMDQNIDSDATLMEEAIQYSKDLNHLLSRVMICQTTLSKFFNYLIIPIPEMRVQELPCSVGFKYLKSIKECAELTIHELRKDHNR